MISLKDGSTGSEGLTRHSLCIHPDYIRAHALLAIIESIIKPDDDWKGRLCITNDMIRRRLKAVVLFSMCQWLRPWKILFAWGSWHLRLSMRLLRFSTYSHLARLWISPRHSHWQMSAGKHDSDERMCCSSSLWRGRGCVIDRSSFWGRCSLFYKGHLCLVIQLLPVLTLTMAACLNRVASAGGTKKGWKGVLLICCARDSCVYDQCSWVESVALRTIPVILRLFRGSRKLPSLDGEHSCGTKRASPSALSSIASWTGSCVAQSMK